MLLGKLGLHLLEHLLLNHASEAILHGISRRLKGTESRGLLSLLLFKLALNLGIKQDLDKALHGTRSLLFFRNYFLDVFLNR